MVKITISLLLLVQTTLFAQVDSVKMDFAPKYRFGKSMILPASLVVTGIVVKETNFREYFQEKIQNSNFRTNTKIDDYIQYAPIFEFQAYNLLYSKSKNEIFQNSKNLFIAELLTHLIVKSIKHSTNVRRPNGRLNSFFSGHTSQSFTSATALYLEFRDENRFLALSGYGFSTATGILRVTNNMHWFSDVLVGAGVGIISARLVWYVNPFPNWKPFKDSKVVVYPYVNGLAGNAGLCMVF